MYLEKILDTDYKFMSTVGKFTFVRNWGIAIRYGIPSTGLKNKMLIMNAVVIRSSMSLLFFYCWFCFTLICVVVFCFKHMFLFPLSGKTSCSSCPYITEYHHVSMMMWHSWIGSCLSDFLAKGVYFQQSLISTCDSPSWIFLVGCCERWGLC